MNKINKRVIPRRLCPAAVMRRAAMPWPMMPRPMNPTRALIEQRFSKKGKSSKELVFGSVRILHELIIALFPALDRRWWNPARSIGSTLWVSWSSRLGLFLEAPLFLWFRNQSWYSWVSVETYSWNRLSSGWVLMLMMLWHVHLFIYTQSKFYYDCCDSSY